MNKLKVKNIIIGKQYDISENYTKMIKIANEKKINVIVAKEGDRMHIEKDLYFDILWPSSTKAINENSINNNSLVFKLIYKKFSVMFTGDIEEIAEKLIIEKYDKNILKSNVLKVAHHGSKTSSIKEFINIVNPEYAIISVGRNNKFGHPSEATIKNLKLIGVNIYRTDEMGEIIITTDGSVMKIKKVKNE